MPRKKKPPPEKQRHSEQHYRIAKGQAKPPPFTRYQIVQLTKVIATGNHFTVACALSGLSWATVESALERGRTGDPAYAFLVEEFDKAEAESERVAVDIITLAATKGLKRTVEKQTPDGIETVEEYNPDWRAAAFLLEHRFGNRWAAMRRLKVAGMLNTKTTVVIHDDGEALEEAEEVMRELESEGSAGSDD